MTGSVLNILIKVVALFLAVLLWFNVITEKQYEYEINLPVTSVELPAGMSAVTPFPDSLMVKVLAEGKKLLRNDWKQAGLRIKATRLRRGINVLELNLETVSLIRSEHITLLELLNAAPVNVHLDRADSALKPIASRLTVLPQREHMIVAGKGSVFPPKVKAFGPSGVLGGIDSIYTETRTLDGIENSVSVPLGLIIPDSLEVTLSQDSVVIEVVVDQILHKKYAGIPVVVASGSAAGRVMIVPDRVTVEINGPETLFEPLSEKDIRVRAIPPKNGKSGYVRPQITLPPNFSVASVTPDSLRITISP
jgi:hypothetical protein